MVNFKFLYNTSDYNNTNNLFLFNVGHWYKLCSEKAGGSIYNGRGCYDYAKRDVNPDDTNKGYWRSL